MNQLSRITAPATEPMEQVFYGYEDTPVAAVYSVDFSGTNQCVHYGLLYVRSARELAVAHGVFGFWRVKESGK